MRHLARAALFGAAVLLAGSAVRATTAVEMTENDLILQASDIVVGKCIAVQSQWIGRDLVTLASIEVTESMKGSGSSLITVVIPGGSDARRAVPVIQSFPGAPSIRDQEKVLLFLIHEDRVANGYAIVGFSQGKFSLAENPQGRKMASQDLTQLHLLGEKGSRLGESNAIVLDDLRIRVQRALAKENAR